MDPPVADLAADFMRRLRGDPAHCKTCLSVKASNPCKTCGAKISAQQRVVDAMIVAHANLLPDVNVLARLLWADWWFSEAERRSERTGQRLPVGPGQNIYYMAPRTPPRAIAAARPLAEAIVQANRNMSLSALYLEAMGEHPEEHRKFATPEEFGNMLAFMIVGHGVSWNDDHPEGDLKVPYREFYL